MKVNKKYNCLFIGNAIVDVVSEVSFDFLEKQKIEVGSWRPVSINEINELQDNLDYKYNYIKGQKILQFLINLDIYSHEKGLTPL